MPFGRPFFYWAEAPKRAALANHQEDGSNAAAESWLSLFDPRRDGIKVEETFRALTS